MPPVLGIATIGHAPREDMLALFARHAPDGSKIVLRGCLDGLTDQQIGDAPPEDGTDTLYTRLRGGRDVKISKQMVVMHAPDALMKLRDDGCDAIVFACTGEFPPMRGDTGVLFPSRLLNGLVSGLLPRGRLGLLVPLPEQAATLVAKWSRPGLDVVAEALSPGAGPDEAAMAAERLKARQPDMVAMDCMSYTPDSKAIVRAAIGVPTILAITVTGRVLNEMLA